MTTSSSPGGNSTEARARARRSVAALPETSTILARAPSGPAAICDQLPGPAPAAAPSALLSCSSMTVLGGLINVSRRPPRQLHGLGIVESGPRGRLSLALAHPERRYWNERSHWPPGFFRTGPPSTPSPHAPQRPPLPPCPPGARLPADDGLRARRGSDGPSGRGGPDPGRSAGGHPQHGRERHLARGRQGRGPSGRGTWRRDGRKARRAPACRRGGPAAPAVHGHPAPRRG